MSSALADAREALAGGEPKRAAQLIKVALKEDPKSYDAFVLLSSAALALGEPGQASQALNRATDLDPARLEAWQGLAELAADSGDTSASLQANERLLRLLEPGQDDAARFRAQTALADAYTRAGQAERAAPMYEALLAHDDLFPEERRAIQCRLADLLLRQGEARISEATARRLADADREEEAEGERRAEAAAAASARPPRHPGPAGAGAGAAGAPVEGEPEAAGGAADGERPAPRRLPASPPLSPSRRVARVATPLPSAAPQDPGESLDAAPSGPAPSVPTPPGSPVPKPGAPRRRLASFVRRDAAVEEVTSSATLTELLGEIVMGAPTLSSLRPYAEERLRRMLLRIFSAPHRSAERQALRREALRECWQAVCAPGPGSLSPLPYEAAVWLLEEEEEVRGGPNAAPHSWGLGLGNAHLAPLRAVASVMQLGRPAGAGEGAARPSAEPSGAGGGAAGPAHGGVAHPASFGSFSSLPSGGGSAVSLEAGAAAGPHAHHAGAGGPTLGSGAHLAGSSDSLTDATAVAVVAALENFARRFFHRFPDNPTALASLALMLRRRMLGDGSHAAPQGKRRAIQALLERAMADPSRVDTAVGWKALTELQYQNRDYARAADASARGLHWLAARREAGHEALTQVALGLRLVMAKSLRRLGRLDEAERHFVVLSEWVSEGEAAFGSLAGSLPVSVHQQALRGLALVALARGDREGAKAKFERVLGKAAMGRGPGEHWAHAEYGWLLFEDGDLRGAREHLESAIRVGLSPGAYVTDSQLGEHYARLGEVYWAMGGRYRTEPQFSYAMFLEATKAEGHAQGHAFAGLGRYFEAVRGDQSAAQVCFKRALAIDPNVDLAGEGLVALLVEGGLPSVAATLCVGVCQRAPRAAWAWRQKGRLELADGRPLDGARSLQTAIRLEPGDAASWEALGACYEAAGRTGAALRAYERATDLRPELPFAWMRRGACEAGGGEHTASLRSFARSLAAEPEHPAALWGAARVSLQAARADLRDGCLARASVNLERATVWAGWLVGLHPTCAAAFKALGDAQLEHAGVDPTPKTAGLKWKDVLSDPAALEAASLGLDPATRSPSDAGGREPDGVRGVEPDAREGAGSGEGAGESARASPERPRLPRAEETERGLRHVSPSLGRAGGAGERARSPRRSSSTPALRGPLPPPTSALEAAGRDEALAALRGLAGRRVCVAVALRCYERALELAPSTAAEIDHAAASRALAMLHMERGGEGPARAAELRSSSVARVRLALRADPAEPALWRALGLAETDPAAREYALSRSAQLDPSDERPWVALSRLYTRHGEVELARLAAEQARGRAPARAACWEATAAALRAAGDPAAADEAADEALKLDAGRSEAAASVAAGVGLRIGAGRRAAAARAAVRRAPWRARRRGAAGAAAESGGNWAGAAAEYTAAAVLSDPGSVDSALAHRSLARVLARAGLGDASREVLARLPPGEVSPRSRLVRAVATLEAAGPAAAEPELLQLLRLDDDSAASRDVARAAAGLLVAATAGDPAAAAASAAAAVAGDPEAAALALAVSAARAARARDPRAARRALAGVGALARSAGAGARAPEGAGAGGDEDGARLSAALLDRYLAAARAVASAETHRGLAARELARAAHAAPGSLRALKDAAALRGGASAPRGGGWWSAGLSGASGGPAAGTAWAAADGGPPSRETVRALLRNAAALGHGPAPIAGGPAPDPAAPRAGPRAAPPPPAREPGVSAARAAMSSAVDALAATGSCSHDDLRRCLRAVHEAPWHAGRRRAMAFVASALISEGGGDGGLEGVDPASTAAGGKATTRLHGPALSGAAARARRAAVALRQATAGDTAPEAGGRPPPSDSSSRPRGEGADPRHPRPRHQHRLLPPATPRERAALASCSCEAASVLGDGEAARALGRAAAARARQHDDGRALVAALIGLSRALGRAGDAERARGAAAHAAAAGARDAPSAVEAAACLAAAGDAAGALAGAGDALSRAVAELERASRPGPGEAPLAHLGGPTVGPGLPAGIDPRDAVAIAGCCIALSVEVIGAEGGAGEDVTEASGVAGAAARARELAGRALMALDRALEGRPSSTVLGRGRGDLPGIVAVLRAAAGLALDGRPGAARAAAAEARRAWGDASDPDLRALSCALEAIAERGSGKGNAAERAADAAERALRGPGHVGPALRGVLAPFVR